MKVVNVENDISTLSSKFNIAVNGYIACKFSINADQEIIIEGEGKDNVVPYVCDKTSGKHYYVDYPNEDHSISIESGNPSGYLFLYSKDGADNLTVKVQTKK